MRKFDDKTLSIVRVFNTSVRALDLSTLPGNILRRANIETIGDLYLLYISGKFGRMYGVGKKTLEEVERALDNYLEQALAERF